MRSKKGFTLIELLVVISIISLLSSIVLASLNTARAKARDAARVASLKQVQNAIELYASNHNGAYPETLASAGQQSSDAGRSNSCATYTALDTGCGGGNGDAGGGGDGSCGQPIGDWNNTLQVLVSSNLIGSIPKDPTNKGYANAGSLCYTYTTYPVGPWTPAGHWHTMTCDGEPIGNYSYALLFSTEATNLSLPKFGASANLKYSGYSDGGQGPNAVWNTYTYCILGPHR